MHLECRLVGPARVNEEEVRIARGAKGADRKATRLASRRLHLLAEHSCGRGFLPAQHMETRENEQLHRKPPHFSLRGTNPTPQLVQLGSGAVGKPDLTAFESR